MSRTTIISFVEWIIIVILGIFMFLPNGYTPIHVETSKDVWISYLPVAFLIGVQLYLSKLLAHSKIDKACSIINPLNTFKFFSFFIVLGTLQYRLAALGGPLQDASLVQFDQLLGFSWPDLFHWVENNQWIRPLLIIFYDSLPIQLLAVLFIVCSLYPQRTARFTTAVVISTLLTMFFFWLIPAAGPFVFFQHTDLPEANYTEHFLKVRDHTLTRIKTNDIRGIISFPSFHVSSAVVMTYFFYRIPVALPLVILLNIGLGFAALIIGGHYLCDVIGGMGIGLITIALVRLLYKGQPDERLSL